MSGGDRKPLGRWGEALVAEKLKKEGCRILAAGWYCRMGEIDLIASDGRYLRFVEVKLRKSDRFAQAREAVDRRKQERLRAAAACYLSQHDLDAPARFDVAEVYTDGVHRPLRLEYLENAF